MEAGPLPTSMEVDGSFHGSSFTSVEVGGIYFHGSWWKLRSKLIYFHGRKESFHGSRWKQLVEVNLLPWKLVDSCMQVHGSFRCRWKWKLPFLPSVEVSTNVFRGSFHDVPYTPTYFHLLPRVSQTSSRFHKTNPDHIPNPKLELPPAYLQLRWKQMEASMEVICCFRGSWNYLHESWPPTSMQVGGSFHASRWKQMEAYMEVDEATE